MDFDVEIAVGAIPGLQLHTQLAVGAVEGRVAVSGCAPAVKPAFTDVHELYLDGERSWLGRLVDIGSNLEGQCQQRGRAGRRNGLRHLESGGLQVFDSEKGGARFCGRW